MILALDGSRLVGLRTGVGQVLEYLVRAWSRQPLPFERIRVLSPKPIEDLPQDDRWELELVPGAGSGIRWALALGSIARRADAMFSTYTLPPGFRGASVVYNLGIYEGPYAIGGWRARLRSQHMARSSRAASRVFAISPTTKLDLIRYFKVPEERIGIAWPGHDARFHPPEDARRTAEIARASDILGGSEPYLIFVGKLSPRRNVPQLIEAFSSVAASTDDLRLILVGLNTWQLPLQRMLAELNLGDRVRRVQVDREDLSLLYRFARAFVMPTENDGFSLTILEAMSSGTPVVTLRGAPLGVLDRLEGPRDHARGGPVLEAADARPRSLAEALRRVAQDDELCRELGRRGRRFAATFPSWEQTAAQIMESLAEVAGAPSPREAGIAGKGALS
jgi:glycosyltransferase involved in cell wall biosynthesis